MKKLSNNTIVLIILILELIIGGGIMYVKYSHILNNEQIVTKVKYCENSGLKGFLSTDIWNNVMNVICIPK